MIAKYLIVPEKEKQTYHTFHENNYLFMSQGMNSP